MYKGLRNTDIQELAGKLEQEKLLKRDLVIPSRFLSMKDGYMLIDELPHDLFDGDRHKVVGDLLSDYVRFENTDYAKQLIAEKLGIPKRFYNYLESSHIDLLDQNVSTLFDRAGKNYFCRTFAPTDEDGTGVFRSLLSDRYQVVDNLDVLYSALQAIKEAGAQVKIGRCNLTERKMYIEFKRPEASITAEEYFNKYDAPGGSTDGNIYAGFVISNSEVGAGSYTIVPRAIVGACENGLVFKRDAMRKTHIGSQMDEGIQWSHETRQKELELVKSQIRDAVSHFMSEDFLIDKATQLSGHVERLQNPVHATRNVCKELGITEEEKTDVLNYFLDGGDFSPVGIVQAVTYFAHEQPDADKQYELEADVIDLLPDITTLDLREN